MSAFNNYPNLTPNTNDLQDRIIKAIKHFSEIKNFKIKDEFIQKKINQISEQEIKLKNFAKDYNLKMNDHANKLNIFADSCESDHLNTEELLKSLGKLNDLKITENKSDLLNQIKNIKNDLTRIFNEISDYNKCITGLTNKINKAEENVKEAFSLAKAGVMIVGVGTIVATAAIPLTAGASLAIAFPANAIATLGSSFIFQGTATATVSAVIAGFSSFYRKFLDHELENVREQISKLLQKMQDGLEDINAIIPNCESHFEKQIFEIEEVEKILDFFKKFDDNNHLIKPIARTISTRARKNSEGYNASDIQQALSNILLEQEVDAK